MKKAYQADLEEALAEIEVMKEKSKEKEQPEVLSHVSEVDLNEQKFMMFCSMMVR
jgi:hypothetical protein